MREMQRCHWRQQGSKEMNTFSIPKKSPIFILPQRNATMQLTMQFLKLLKSHNQILTASPTKPVADAKRARKI